MWLFAKNEYSAGLHNLLTLFRWTFLLLLLSSFSMLATGQSLKPAADTFFVENAPFAQLEIEMGFSSCRSWHVKNDGHGGAIRPNFILQKLVDGEWTTAYTYMPDFVLDYAVQLEVTDIDMRVSIPIGEHALTINMYGVFGETPIDNGTYRVKIKLDRKGKTKRTLATNPFQVVLKE